MTARSGRDVSDFIVHHTAGPVAQTPLEIDAEHRRIGDAMIAYTWLIDPKGVVYEGRPAGYVPAAAFGRNTQSLDVSLIGNFEKGDPGYTGPPTKLQIEALIELGVYAHKLFPTIVRTIGHRDVAPMFYPKNEEDYSTACPGSELYSQLPAIRKAIAAKVNNR
jgi:hypothetical protein